jgi:aspartyl-tRNA(Asn)/glutamyl-tRNA(Gln) amidotransferase subunit A
MRTSIQTIALEIARDKLSTTKLIDELLERITRFDPLIESYVTLNPRAKILGKEFAAKLKYRNGSILYAIPVSVKDLIDTRELRTTYGSSLFENNIPSRDARVISNLKKAGCIIIGKTNTHEFALGMETPPTKNPWDLSRIPGGSSGGSAAALAADLAIFALGTDTGGSIRIPASMCGITGLKPTYGAIPNAGVFPEAWSLDHVGPMCRFASDLPLLLQAMGYRIEKTKRPSKKFRLAVERSFVEESAKGVRLAIERFCDKLDSERLIEAAEVKLPLVDEINRTHSVLDTSEIATVHKNIYSKNKDKYLPESSRQIEEGLRHKAVDYVKAQNFRVKAIKELSRAMSNYDLIVTPTIPTTAPRITEIKKMQTKKNSVQYSRFLEPFNLVGFPALSIPCGFAQDLPIGVQLISRSWQEAILIELATKYQNVTNWHFRVPAKYGEFVI